MPNHFHGIVVILNDFFVEQKNVVENKTVGAGLVPAPSKAQTAGFMSLPNRAPTNENPIGFSSPTQREIDRLKNNKTLGDIVGAFKSITTVEYIRAVKIGKFPPINKSIWQRNYYEHIIRSEKSLEKLRDYIQFNPVRWEKDELFKKINL